MTEQYVLGLIRAAPCPRCGAPKGTQCWSQLLMARMENQVHAERKELAYR
jgi:hypothetical protein